MNDKENNDKKLDIKKILKIIGAIATLVAAAAPGTAEFIDDSEDYARQEAKQSGEQAQKSEEMTELAWERVRSELTYLRDQVQELKENDKAKSGLLAEMLLEMARASNVRPPAPVPTSAHSHRFKQVYEDKKKDVSLKGITLKEPSTSAEILLDEVEEHEPVPVPIQQQLPLDLEKEWVKTKKK